MFSKFVKIVPNVFTKVIEATLVIILPYFALKYIFNY